MKGEWLKEWWRHFGVGFIHFKYATGFINTSEPLLLGFVTSENRDTAESLISTPGPDQIGLEKGHSWFRKQTTP
eukprot:3855787-Rhodomonas_salina.1